MIRGGAGIFYDTQLGWWRLGERAVIGGSGRQFIGNAAVINPPTGQPFSPAFLNSLAYNYGTFLAAAAGASGAAGRQVSRAPATSRRSCCRSRRLRSAPCYPHEFPTTQAHHFNFGFQRELGASLAVQADVVYRKMLHGTPGGFFGASVDYNRFNSIEGPVIPACTAAQANDPDGPVLVGPDQLLVAGCDVRATQPCSCG